MPDWWDDSDEIERRIWRAHVLRRVYGGDVLDWVGYLNGSRAAPVEGNR